MRLLCLLVLIALRLQAADSLRVLFVGNSHTFVNNVPLLVESLAVSGAKVCTTDMCAVGGFTLDDHTRTQATLDKIAQGGWDHVVLQEQSQIPTISYWRFNLMYPAARTLDSLIQLAHGSTVFFMTWGWRNGGTMEFRGHTSPPFRDYFEMQDSVAVAYQMIAEELGAGMAPVGLAWAEARRRDSLIDLWQEDESHATLKGSYLGACAFYAVLFESSPVGLGYIAGLDPAEALFLQEVAWHVAAVTTEARLVPRPTLEARPNPFRTLVRLSAPPVIRAPTLVISDATGRIVRTLVAREATGSGEPRGWLWDGRDRSGRPLPAGVYHCRAQGGLHFALLKVE